MNLKVEVCFKQKLILASLGYQDSDVKKVINDFVLHYLPHKWKTLQTGLDVGNYAGSSEEIGVSI